MKKERQIVRDQVREHVITMRAGFKNAANSEKSRAEGVLMLAETLKIIKEEEFRDGMAWVKAEFTAKQMQNNLGFDKYDGVAISACWDFDKHFQD